MKSFPLTPDLIHLAKRMIWYKPPHEALNQTYHFVAHVLTYGMHADIEVLRRYLSDTDLREAITNTPPGIFDARSWAYWNLKIGRYPAPPLPVRKLPGQGER